MADTDFNWREAIAGIERRLEKYEKEAAILFIDDDDNDCTLFINKCEGYFCNITICKNPEEAAKVLKEKHFDFVFIDQKMPRITGLEILQDSLPMPATKFFLVTGYQDSNVVDAALKMGAFYAPKESLKETLGLFLRRK